MNSEVNKKIVAFEKRYGIKLGLYFKNVKTGATAEWRSTETFESSSTIKIALMYLSLLKASKNNFIDLNKQYEITKADLHNGSGIIFWTDWKSLTLRQLLKLMACYSDCVASNVLIRYLGGKDSINKQLPKLGFTITKLHMAPFDFDVDTDYMQQVGSTTPKEMAALFYEAFYAHGPIGNEFKDYTSDVKTSFFMEGLQASNINPYKIWHKTGSMFDCDKSGDTTFNASGILQEPGGTNTMFSLYSRGNLVSVDAKTSLTQEEYSQLVTKIFWDTYLDHLHQKVVAYA